MPPTSNLSKELGVDSPITKNREGVDLPLAYTYLLSYDNKSKKQTAFRLQKWLLTYKTCFSNTKVAFRLQRFYFIKKLSTVSLG